MKLFADHSNGFVTLVFAESIHAAIQARIFINGEECTPILSQITREEPISYDLLRGINKTELISQFVNQQIKHVKLLYQKEVVVDENIILSLLEKFNPTVWFNFSNSQGEEWCVTTMLKAEWTTFGQAVSDYLQTL